MSEAKRTTDLKRENTMQVTAKEGIRLLKDAGEHALLEMQGLQMLNTNEDNNESDVDLVDNDDLLDEPGSAMCQKPRMQRASTMAVTAKEGKQFLLEQKFEGKCGRPMSTKTKPKLSKFTTMLQTKQEGEAFLAAQETNKTNNQEQGNDEPASKKLKVIDEKIENKKTTGNKRISVLQRTTKEGEELLKEMGHKDDDPDSERRRTRSQTRGDPTPTHTPPSAVKKDNSTKKDPNNGGKRGRKGRPRKEENQSKESKSDDKLSPTLDSETEENDLNKTDAKKVEGGDETQVEVPAKDKSLAETETETEVAASVVSATVVEDVMSNDNEDAPPNDTDKN